MVGSSPPATSMESKIVNMPCTMRKMRLEEYLERSKIALTELEQSGFINEREAAKLEFIKSLLKKIKNRQFKQGGDLV